MKCSKLMIAGVQSGVGKTTVTLGILKVLAKRMKVQSYKVGPDYIDPTFHSHITGRKCRNLDDYLVEPKWVQQLFYENMKAADIGIIEGVMGLYDGLIGGNGIGSSASVAKLIQAPVILVVDGSGISTSIAAIVQGFQQFDTEVNLAGVIVNRVGSQRHYAILKEAIESHTNIKCYGYLKKGVMTLESRHLGLIPSHEVIELDRGLEQLSQTIEETIDIEGLLKLAHSKSSEIPMGTTEDIHKLEPIHIGVAYDEAFHFYYQDNLDLLEKMGGRISFFSPLRDTELPKDIDLLYIGGGFPEVFGKELSDNQILRNHIKDALVRGLPYYAECGGLMYLSENIKTLAGDLFPMVGFIEGTCSMTKGLKGFGYKALTLLKDCILGEKGMTIPVHEFHHSELITGIQNYGYHLVKFRGQEMIQESFCGYIKGNGIAGYPHLHFYGNLKIAKNLIKTAKKYRLYRNG